MNSKTTRCRVSVDGVPIARPSARGRAPKAGAGTTMTLRDAGWFGAGLLVALLGFILYGWRVDSTQRGSGSAIAASSTHPSAAAAAVHGGGSLDAMLAQLEGRLRAGSGKESDWELLAQTYDYLGRKVDAGNARDKHEVASAAPPD